MTVCLASIGSVGLNMPFFPHIEKSTVFYICKGFEGFPFLLTLKGRIELNYTRCFIWISGSFENY